jgi:protein TonB
MMPLQAVAASDLRRWVLSAALVMLAHGALAAALVTWREEVDPDDPAAAIAVEFAPLPVAPANRDMDIPPGPEQIMSEASPERPTETVKETAEDKPEQKNEPVEEPPPDVKPAPNPEIAVEPARQVKESPQPVQPRPPAPATTAPQSAPVQTAAIPAAPVQGQPTPRSSRAIPTWKTKIVALLERNKRYPPTAQSRGEHGVAEVFFSLDRQGRVVESRIMRSSGASSLDEEALALLQRAQPFPAPPSEMSGVRVDLTVPIRFNLR